jgi:preprotein translocase subunit Sec63
MSFGIALPSWIVEKENSVWVKYVYFIIVDIKKVFLLYCVFYNRMALEVFFL